MLDPAYSCSLQFKRLLCAAGSGFWFSLRRHDSALCCRNMRTAVGVLSSGG